ncbi:MAG: NAD(P)H-hydrate epimerase [Candidatus Omnitrophica bacterium]|nr:NAD(P)H-hydrate epimerase [Candidatus Omnitrophota bacterium]
MKSVTASRMAEIDRIAQEEYGIPQISLMENAGRAVYAEILKALEGEYIENIYILCGKGNNGGDGFVAARHLYGSFGEKVRVYAVDAEGMKEGAARKNMERASSLIHILPAENFLDEDIHQSVLVDALFGTGFTGEVRGISSGVIDKINAPGCPVFSVDVPSGLDATTGKASKHCVKASKTITFGLPKKGFYENEGPEKCGKIVVADIGFPKELLDKY